MRGSVIVLFVLTTSGCCVPSAPPAPRTHVRPAEPVAEQAPAPEPPPVEPHDPPNAVRREVHVAAFVDDELTQCADIAVLFLPPDPLPTPWPPPTHPMPQETDMVQIQRPCADSFADRTPMGTCVTHQETTGDDHVHRVVDTTELYYSGHILENDRPMRECLQNGGDWTGVDRDSAAAQEARLRQARHELDALQHHQH